MKTSEQRCTTCGSELPFGIPQGLCPRCALNAAARDKGMAVTLPRDFGDYELLETIARGGMGIVYRARQKSLGRTVAVKMLLHGSEADFEALRRFRVEAVAAGRLQHPNIVAVHEVGQHDGQPFIVMDYVAGPNLARYARAPLPPRRAAEILAVIALAIHHAHTREPGILHRDLKPSNIIIDEQGQPHITDFGLAKGLGQPAPEQDSAQDHAAALLLMRRTVEGQVLGSPAYMPPEQADGRTDQVGTWSDIYALGAVLYHMQTGRPPFEGGSVAQTLHRVLHDEVLPPRALNPSVSRDLETICLKCLEKEPGRRYQTAEQLADELNRFLCGRPVQARPIGRALRVVRWARRNPALAGLFMVLFVSIGILIGLLQVLNEGRRSDQEAISAIRKMVVENLEELWQRSDKTSEVITSDQLAALAGRRKSPAPPGARQLRMGLLASVAPVDRAVIHQPMLDFMEKQLERRLGRPVRLDLVLFKGERLEKPAAQNEIDLMRMSALVYLQARDANPRMLALAQENTPKEAVIFAMKRTGITNLSQVRSIAFADTNSNISAWAKVHLVRAGVSAARLDFCSNIVSVIRAGEDPEEYYSHREAVRAVRDGRFDAGVGRPARLAAELGTNWVALWKFESSQTIWAAGGKVSAEEREALQAALLALPRIRDLPLPDRVRSLTPLDGKSLRELEEALRRELRLFETPLEMDHSEKETSP